MQSLRSLGIGMLCFHMLLIMNFFWVIKLESNSFTNPLLLPHGNNVLTKRLMGWSALLL